ncbi:hypothetical protein ASG01_09025 [Chryseobacterium sp. Leaf180]|uniref:DUF2147 domain-containing protein n=1 Tax=Chryseobacterium sp. Leaf180 TaxID=1736289 RepID=UPI0007020B5A|nr:DUF2147 domain-containing protein [Chryseobacterium sp. Leaf180]KQR93329.1 hypothetical protein ASG01_09025 [Chryseobacterium sp. Leaf180]
MSKIFLLPFFLICFCGFGQRSKDDILGKWMATDKSVAVNVYLEGNSFRAKVIWFDERLSKGKPMNSRVDSENPDVKLRHNKIIGMDVLEGLNFNAKNQRWENGKIYDASTGRTWDASAELKNNGQMCVRGFWKWKFIGKTLCFARM